LELLQARQLAVLLAFKFPNTNMDLHMIVQPLNTSHKAPFDCARDSAYTVDEATVWPPTCTIIQERIDKL